MITDNKAVIDFVKNKRTAETKANIIRRYNYLQEYLFSIKHIKCSNNFLAEYFSKTGEVTDKGKSQ